MKKQKYNNLDNRGGRREQTSRPSEPSARANGWDDDIRPESSSRKPATADWSNAPDYQSVDLAGDVDAGYFDQKISILGTDVTVRVAYTAKGVDMWIDECHASERFFGFDIEWRPNFQKGQENYAAVCQLSSATRCLIVQLLHIDYIPDKFKAFLANPGKKLAGVGVKGDINKLYEDYGLKCRGEVDLGLYAANVFKDPNLKKAALATLCGKLLGFPYKKNKRVTMSNWAVHGLSYNQIVYAATDAWIAYSLLATLETEQREQRSAGQSRADPRVTEVGGTLVGSVRTDEAGHCRA